MKKKSTATKKAAAKVTHDPIAERIAYEGRAELEASGEMAKPVEEPKKSKLGSLLRGSTVEDTSPHLIIEARAGCGKTTTLIEGLKIIKGLPTSLIPSEQQKKIWEAMALSSGKIRNAAFVAFNKSIADELKARVPAGYEALTMHSLGFRAVNNAYSGLKVNQYRVVDIISSLLGKNPRDLRRDNGVLLKAVESLVGLVKMNLSETDSESLQDLVDYYDIDLNGSKSQVFDLVPKVIEACKDVYRDNCVNFDDMVWLPVVSNLPVFQYDLLLWDEQQDGNRCQQALAKRAGKRLILCGDPRQALYAFAGADSQSMSRMEEELKATERGCVKLPLTVTRRCGKAIVNEAKKLVPDFEAHETNSAGRINDARFNEKTQGLFPLYQTLVSEGDFVLCRVNAPLVSECFRFIKQGKRANIQGRDVGQGLISTIKKLKADTVPTLVGKISDWLYKETEKENAKRNPSENRLIALQDRADCLVCFTENANTIEEIVGKIESMFTDDKTKPGIRLSSIHKSKGLEANRVFLLQPDSVKIPPPKTQWQAEQNVNCLYVAITRAIHELVYVR